MIIAYQKFTFTLEADGQIVLPAYKGSTFRGGFGSTFRRVVCALKRKECNECMLKSKCTYAYIFETSPSEDTNIMGMSKYEKIPHPFIIEPPMENLRAYEPGDSLIFQLVLVGDSLDYLPYFIYTFEELGKIGIGRRRGKYKLQNVTSNENLVYSAKDRMIKNTPPAEIIIPEGIAGNANEAKTVTLNFITPARISYQRGLTSDLQFHILIRNLIRRLNLLYYFHCGKTASSMHFKSIIDEAGKISVERNSLKWWDWERYSTRQGVSMKMGGVIGEITYSGNVDPFLPILHAGEILHVGKGTSFGLGKYIENKK